MKQKKMNFSQVTQNNLVYQTFFKKLLCKINDNEISWIRLHKIQKANKKILNEMFRENLLKINVKIEAWNEFKTLISKVEINFNLFGKSLF
jgi:hypothetical protein